MNSKIQLGRWMLDTESGELTQPHQKIVLLKQQHLLLMTPVRAGQNCIVSTQNINDAFWPDGTVVEFDQSLDASARKLSRVFYDNSKNPEYIETVVDKGSLRSATHYVR